VSKIEKQIQNAHAWRKKHKDEALDFTKLDGALAQWELQKKQLEEAKAKVQKAKEDVALAQKTVTAALKEVKGSRKPAPEVKVKKEKKVSPQ